MTNWKDKYPIGSQWKTRGDEPEEKSSGWRCVVVGHSNVGPIVCHSDNNTDVDEIFTVQHDWEGVAVSSPFCPGAGDLITPWKEPRTGKASVWVDDNGDTHYDNDKVTEWIISGKALRKIAVVPWTEGDGMEDSE